MSDAKKKPADVAPAVAVETPDFVAYPVVPEATARPAREQPPPEEEEESFDEDELDEERDDEESDGRPAAASFLKPLTPSPEFARIVGAAPLTRVEAVKRLWEHIKKHGLQDRKNPRNINADEALKAVLGRDSVSMFEMTALVMRHLS